MKPSHDTLFGLFLLFNLAMGFFSGLFPLLIGRAYRRQGEGIAGMVICLICGFFGSFFFAVPMSILFTLAILFLGKNDAPEPVETLDFETRVQRQREIALTNKKLAAFDELEQQKPPEIPNAEPASQAIREGSNHLLSIKH